MAYAAWSVIFGEQPSAAKWNILGTNDAYFDSIVGSGTAWATYSPTLANMSTGNGTLTAKYIQVGKTVRVFFKIVFGTTSTIGTAPTFTLPVTAASEYSSQFNPLCQAHGEDSGIAAYALTFGLNASTTIVGIFAQNAAGTYVAPTSGITAAAPFAWGPGDWICGTFAYEAA